MQMDSVIEALKKAKVISKFREILGNSNFLLDKVLVVAQEQYLRTSNQKCNELNNLRNKYAEIIEEYRKKAKK